MRPSLAAGRNIPYRTLGRTGEKVSLIGVGDAHIGKQEDENESIRIIRTAIDRGINFMDNSWATTMDRARSGWERRCVMGTGTKSS
jgi:predicted aldo/keto reductase-like oxidoreductase